MQKVVRRETLVSTGKGHAGGGSQSHQSLADRPQEQVGPESFKGRRRAYAPRRIPDRVPVTAGIRSETAMRPLGLALFSRLDSQLTAS